MGELHKKIFERYAPASVLVGAEAEIVHLSENINRFLQPDAGAPAPSSKLFNVALPALQADLKIVLLEAKQTGRPAQPRIVPVEIDGEMRFVRLSARPVASSGAAGDDLYLVVFDDSSPVTDEILSQSTRSDGTGKIISRLQKELSKAARRQTAKAGQYEVAAEELNSVKEELRLVNRDSEQNKQEIKIVNEQLHAANEALNERSEQLIRTDSVLHNLINSTNIGTIFLDRDLNIKQFTPHINEFFKLRRSDIGRPLERLANELDCTDLTVNARDVLRTLQPIEHEVRLAANRDFNVRFLPYRTTDNRVDGVVLTFMDITTRKRAERALAFLAEISQDLAHLTGVDEIIKTVGAKIGAFLKLSVCAFTEIDETGNEAVTTHTWHRADAVDVAGPYRLSEYLTDDFQKAGRAGEIFIVNDTQTDSRTDAGKYAALKIGSFLSVPLVRNGEWRFLLVVCRPEAYEWRSEEIELVRELTTRIWTRLERAGAEDALRESENRLEQQSRIFDTTLSSITDFAYIFDKEGRFVYSNQPLLDLLGITLKEIAGKNFFDLKYPDDLAARLQRQIQQVFDTCETVRDETPFISATTGAGGFYEYIFSPVTAADGSVELVAGSTRDVTMRKASEESIRFQAHLLNTVEQAVIATDLDGIVIYWNRFAEKLYEWTADEAVGRNIINLTTPDVMNEQAAEIMSQLRQSKSWSGEFTVRRRDGATFQAQVINSPINDENGELIGIVGVSFDITKRKQAEEDLRESEERVRLIINSVEDYAIITTDVKGIISIWNPGAEKAFGYTAPETIGKPADFIFTPEDRERNVPEREMQIALEKGRAEDERPYLRRDGSRFFASGVMQPLKDGKIDGFVKVLRDSTERIKAEQIERDKEMLQKLVGAQEDERKRIARDLHDELGQLLTGLRLKLESVRGLCEDNDDLSGKIDETQLLAGRIDDGIDFLAWELRPAALDDLGLHAALAKYVREWSHYTGVTAEFLGSSIEKMRLAPEAEINLYRIVQESLNNIHKHARATRAGISLDKRGNDLIVLIIEDDGAGFDPQDKMNREKGIGLTGMRERAVLIGGTLEIESAPGSGTTVFVRVPTFFAKEENMEDTA